MESGKSPLKLLCERKRSFNAVRLERLETGPVKRLYLRLKTRS